MCPTHQPDWHWPFRETDVRCKTDLLRRNIAGKIPLQRLDYSGTAQNSQQYAKDRNARHDASPAGPGPRMCEKVAQHPPHVPLIAAHPPAGTNSRGDFGLWRSRGAGLDT